MRDATKSIRSRWPNRTILSTPSQLRSFVLILWSDDPNRRLHFEERSQLFIGALRVQSTDGESAVSEVYSSISGTVISQSWKRYGVWRNSIAITIYRRLTGYVSERVDGTADAYASHSYEYQVWHLQSNPCSRVGRERALYRGDSCLRSLNPQRSRVDH